MVFSTIFAISPPIPIHFGCSRARFVGGRYRNLYLYPYLHVPCPQPMQLQKPLTITNSLVRLISSLSFPPHKFSIFSHFYRFLGRWLVLADSGFCRWHHGEL